MTLLDVYLPPEFSDDELARMDRATAVQIVLSELEKIATQPATLRAANMGLLFRSPLAKKANVGADWGRKILETIVQSAEQKAREAAIAAARASGALSASDQLWTRVAVGAQYPLPEGVIIEPGPRGGYVFRDVLAGVVGPAVYPIQELEDGTIRFGGWDRWGRAVDLVLPFADLENPKKCQTGLAAVGARMERPGLWSYIVQKILSTHDLAVPDPEPLPSAEDELSAIWAALRATGYRAQKDGAMVVPVGAFEAAHGALDRLSRRRWAERGWLVPDPATGRYTHPIRWSGQVVRGFVFRLPAAVVPAPAPDQGLQALADADRAAVR